MSRDIGVVFPCDGRCLTLMPCSRIRLSSTGVITAADVTTRGLAEDAAQPGGKRAISSQIPALDEVKPESLVRLAPVNERVPSP